MPFSFIDIEKKKSRVIAAIFLFLVLFYFLTAFFILCVLENTVFYSPGERALDGFRWPQADHVLVALMLAFCLGWAHWFFSTNQLIPKICRIIGAVSADPKDFYHHYFQNIVDEVSVAIGGRQIKAVVVPSAGCNAFALEDFSGQAVIGATEGLLMRLSRPQIEAVVGHEAGHIANGDCQATSVACAISEIYEETVRHAGGLIKRSRGRTGLPLLAIYFILVVMRFLSSLVRYFISRQREYRADATAVRLTRDPVSLAEALVLISRNWRGGGAQGERLESIFIVNPRIAVKDDRHGLLADLFSTHPPIQERVRILLDMAHLDEKTLEEKLKSHRVVSPVAKAQYRLDPVPRQGARWQVFEDGRWSGPFSLEELSGLEIFRPDSWVRVFGEEGRVRHAYEEESLLGLFSREGGLEGPGAFACPHCRVQLEQVMYEGADIRKCPRCEGAFVEKEKLSRILIRQDMDFDDETRRLAQTLISSKKKIFLDKSSRLDSNWCLKCPDCESFMNRQFFVYSYPVEIDRCPNCEAIWFDKRELEILQCLYESKEELFAP